MNMNMIAFLLIGWALPASALITSSNGPYRGKEIDWKKAEEFERKAMPAWFVAKPKEDCDMACDRLANAEGRKTVDFECRSDFLRLRSSKVLMAINLAMKENGNVGDMCKTWSYGTALDGVPYMEVLLSDDCEVYIHCVLDYKCQKKNTDDDGKCYGFWPQCGALKLDLNRRRICACGWTTKDKCYSNKPPFEKNERGCELVEPNTTETYFEIDETIYYPPNSKCTGDHFVLRPSPPSENNWNWSQPIKSYLSEKKWTSKLSNWIRHTQPSAFLPTPHRSSRG